MSPADPVHVTLFGDPVGHSVSPAMHHAAAHALNLDLTYTAQRVSSAELSAAIHALRGAYWLGANVTLPHKLAALALADGVSTTARHIGAVNTLNNRGDQLLGENTDAPALIRCLYELLDLQPAQEQIVVLGAGGAARAVVVALLDLGVAHVHVYNRSSGRAAALAADLNPASQAERASVVSTGDLRRHLRQSTLVINATSVGLDGVSSPLPDLPLAPGARVFDLVYGPNHTPLVRGARQAGFTAVDGLWMLAYQAAASFALWTGRQPPEHVMYEAATAALRERQTMCAPEQRAEKAV